MCSVCQQTQFKEKVNDINRLKKKYTNLLNQCKTNYKSVNNQEYICHTCKDYIYKGKVPKLSIKKMVVDFHTNLMNLTYSILKNDSYPLLWLSC